MTARLNRLSLLAVAFYALLSFILLSAIVFHTGTRVAGFDYFNYNWNFWWMRHALTNGLDIYQSDYVFFPIVSNFGYHALTAFWFPVWALLEPLIGTLAAVNVILFIGCFLNGYVLFVFLRWQRVAPGLALLGGVALQGAPLVRYFYYNTHLNLMDWFWVPAHLLLWGQIVTALEHRQPRRALVWAVIQGCAVWGMGLTDLQFPIFVGFLLIPYALWTVWKSPARLRLVLMGVLVQIVALPLLWFAGPLPHMLAFEGEFLPGPATERPGIPFPGGYLWTYPVWWWWDVPTLGGTVTIALLVTLLVTLLARRWPAKAFRALSSPPTRSDLPPRWFWFFCVLLPLILSMGPTISLFGVAIPMPYRLMHQVTEGMFRMPWRLAPIYIIAAVTFIGLMWTPLIRGQRRMRPFLFAGLLLLIVRDARLYETGPLDPRSYEVAVLDPTPLDPAPPHYDFYAVMGREPYEYVVIDAPTGRGTGEALVSSWQGIQFQFYGMIHGKRMVNGFVSRAVQDDLAPVLFDPLLSWLGQQNPLDPTQVELILRDRVFNWPIGYIVVHENIIGRSTITPQEIYGYFNSLPDLLCPIFFEPGAVVYRTTWHPDGCPQRTPPEVEPGVYPVDLGARGDERYIGWGWHWAEDAGGLTVRWAGEYPQTRLYVDLPPGAYTVELSAQAFWEDRSLRLLVNDVPLGAAQIVRTDTLQTLTFELPAEVVADGQHLTLTLAYDGWVVPSEVGQSGDPRKLAVMVDVLRFVRAPG